MKRRFFLTGLASLPLLSLFSSEAKIAEALPAPDATIPVGPCLEYGCGQSSSPCRVCGLTAPATVIHINSEQFSEEQMRELIRMINESTREGGRVILV